jgi:hypothetical protein
MRPAPVAALAALLALTLGLAGCIEGRIHAATIPDDRLAPGWSYDAQNSFSGTAGPEPVVRAHYRVNVYQHPPSLSARTGPGAAFVISAPNVPLVDVQGLLGQQITSYLAEQGIQTTERNRGTGEVFGQQVSYTVFDARKDNLDGFAIDIPYTCAGNGQFVRVYGFAATQAGFGGSVFPDLSTWRELAGEAEVGRLGGMLTAVKCAP